MWKQVSKIVETRFRGRRAGIHSTGNTGRILRQLFILSFFFLDNLSRPHTCSPEISLHHVKSFFLWDKKTKKPTTLKHNPFANQIPDKFLLKQHHFWSNLSKSKKREGCKAGGNSLQLFWNIVSNYYYSPFLMEEREVQKTSQFDHRQSDHKAVNLTFMVSSWIFINHSIHAKARSRTVVTNLFVNIFRFLVTMFFKPVKKHVYFKYKGTYLQTGLAHTGILPGIYKSKLRGKVIWRIWCLCH